jgi:hypothetical protein
MNFPLTFRDHRKYHTRDGKPSVQAILSFGPNRVECVAYIDTGATVCLFQRELADDLEIDVESGTLIRLSTLTGSLLAYGHELTLQTGELAFQTTVYFAKEYGLQRNLLGKFGWLQLIRFGIVDYDEEVFFSHYNDPA